MLSPVRFSEERNLSKDKEMDLARGKTMLQQSHVLHVIEVLTDVARMLLAIVE